MDRTWLIYTFITVCYVIVLVIYFLRRSKTHEKELAHFLQLAQDQLETHKKQTETIANQKVQKAMLVVKKVQSAAAAFEQEAQTEYTQIIEDAKNERRELIAKAKAEIETLFKQADTELEEYKLSRHREIEKNLVKLVIAVTEKVISISLDPKTHKDIIYKALEEVRDKHTRS